MRHFYVTTKFIKDPHYYGLRKQGEVFVNNEGEEYYFSKETSYDKGWGPESVFISNKEYTFEELIGIINMRTEIIWDDRFGAIGFIYEGSSRQSNFVTQLIDFMATRVRQNDWHKCISQYTKYLFFSSHIDGLLDSIYIEKLRGYDKWNQIESEVLENVLSIDS